MIEPAPARRPLLCRLSTGRGRTATLTVTVPVDAAETAAGAAVRAGKEWRPAAETFLAELLSDRLVEDLREGATLHVELGRGTATLAPEIRFGQILLPGGKRLVETTVLDLVQAAFLAAGPRAADVVFGTADE